jgi:hypothetical protein
VLQGNDFLLSVQFRSHSFDSMPTQKITPSDQRSMGDTTHASYPLPLAPSPTTAKRRTLSL